MKILITEFMEDASVEILKKFFDVTVDKSLALNHNELKKIISNFDILIVMFLFNACFPKFICDL